MIDIKNNEIISSGNIINKDNIDKNINFVENQLSIMINDFPFRDQKQKDLYIETFKDLVIENKIEEDIFLKSFNSLKYWKNLTKRPSPIDLFDYLFIEHIRLRKIKELERKRQEEYNKRIDVRLMRGELKYVYDREKELRAIEMTSKIKDKELREIFINLFKYKLVENK